MADDMLTTCLWFDGKAEEAAHFYTSLLPDSRINSVVANQQDMPGGKAGSVMAVDFTLAGQKYLALNGGPMFKFTPAVSIIVHCAKQQEIDRLWTLLLDGGTPMQCGWITDRYGFTWQIVPSSIVDMMKDPDKAKVRRVTAAMMPMVKIDADALRRAFDGEAG